MSSIKVTQTPNFTPTTEQLNVGDILINSYDGNVFVKQQQNKTQNIINLRSTGSNVTKIIAGSNISISPTGGTGIVTINASTPISASYALSSSYALNGGVTKIIAGTNVVLSPIEGTGTVTINAVLASTGSGVPNGPLYSLQYNNGGIFSGSNNFTLLNNNALYLTGSLNVSGSIIGSFTGSLFGTSSWSSNAVTASYIITAQTASYVLNAVSSSRAVSSSYAVSSSFLINPMSYIASQAITASVNTDTNTLFLIKSGSIDVLKINSEKVLITLTQSITPTPIIGGLFISSSGDFFFGV